MSSTFHQTTIGNENLEIIDRVDKIVYCLIRAPINKIMSATTIDENHNFMILNVAPNF